jgi:hypothetical protein
MTEDEMNKEWAFLIEVGKRILTSDIDTLNRTFQQRGLSTFRFFLIVCESFEIF